MQGIAKMSSLVQIPQIFYDNLWVSHESGYLLQAKKLAIFVGWTTWSFRKLPQFKRVCIINPQNI